MGRCLVLSERLTGSISVSAVALVLDESLGGSLMAWGVWVCVVAPPDTNGLGCLTLCGGPTGYTDGPGDLSLCGGPTERLDRFPSAMEIYF